MTRIIGGVHGGRRLRTPDGDLTRPTSDRVREALFSSIEARFGTLDRLSVLDLYAGSAAIALESASRGATTTVAVESDRRVAAVARGNAEALGTTTIVASSSVAAFLAQPATVRAHLVFLDPPYPLADDAVVRDLALLVEHGWLDDDALVVVERSSRSPEPSWPDGLAPLPGKRRQKKYGETTLWFAEPAGG